MKKLSSLGKQLVLASAVVGLWSGCSAGPDSAEEAPSPAEENHLGEATEAIQPGFWWGLGTPPSRTIVSAPSASSWGRGRMDIVVRASDNHVWLINGDNVDDAMHCWHAWADMGAPAVGSPAAGTPAVAPGVFLIGRPAIVSRAQYKQDIYTIGTDGNLWNLWLDGTWSAWYNLGRPPGNEAIIGVDVASNPLDGSMHMVVTGAGTTYWTRDWNWGWGGWTAATAPSGRTGAIAIADNKGLNNYWID